VEEDSLVQCYICSGELRWEGDEDLEMDDCDDSEYCIITFLNCDGCGSHVEVYHPTDLDLSRTGTVTSNRGYTHDEIAPD
jgi:hypothetical protein